MNRSTEQMVTLGVLAVAALIITFLLWQQKPSNVPPAMSDAGQVEYRDPPGPAALSIVPDGEGQRSLPEPAAMVVEQDGDVTAEWGEFVVFQRVAKDCRTVVSHGNKAMGETNLHWICDHETIAAHPYAEFSTKQLQQIADTDGIAALILGVRLRGQATTIEDYQTAIQHLYTAVALTGEPEVYEILMAEQGILIGTTSNRLEDDIAEKSQAYVWAKAGNELGLIEANDLRRAEQAIQASDPDAMDRLDSMAWQLAENFRQERVQRTGEFF